MLPAYLADVLPMSSLQVLPPGKVAMVKILLVEDDSAIGAVFSAALTDQRYIVNWVTEGEQGLELATSVEYDLILLDRILPRLDGLSLCRQLRAQGNQTPILLMTARSDDMDIVAGLDAGADDYLIKPCSIPELLARVRALLRRGEVVIPTLLTWEKLCLNPIAAHVTYSGQLLTLTAKEYGLLELFLRNPQRIFSRTAILDRLWEFDTSPNESAVTNHIKELRQKLKTAGMAIDPIETVYGLGYRLRSAPQPEQAIEHLLSQEELRLEQIAPFSQQIADLHQALAQPSELMEIASPENPSDRHEAEARILVVDDDPTTLAALDYLLTPWGVEVTGLSHPERFQEVLSITHPDLLILDLYLPSSSSVDFCQRVRQDSRWGDLPILVVTAHTDTASIQQVFAAGADDFVGKPIVGPELVTRVISRLERLRVQRRAGKLKQKRSNPTGAASALAKPESAKPESAKPELAKSELAKPELTASSLLHTHANLLLVDDQLDNLRTLSAILNGRGYKVRKAISGETALATVQSQPPDLILLDVRMPNMDGYEVCAALKADETTREIPIIFLSALDDTSDKLKAFAVGGADYITKPFQAEEVLTRIKHQLVIRQQQRQLIEQNHQLQREMQERQRSNAALHRTQNVLHESEDRFRSAFDHASIGMALIGLDDRWLKVNPTLCQMLGYSEPELLCFSVSHHLPAEAADQHLACLQSMLSPESQSCQLELQFICKSQQLIWVLISISLVRNAENQPLYYVAQLQDITERKAIEQMKDEFVSMVSHELRTPLTAIQGSISLLASGKLDQQPERAKQMLSIAASESDRLVRLVCDVLDLDRLNSGQVELLKEPCNVADLMQRSIASVQPIADSHAITLALSPLSQDRTPELWHEIWASPDAILQTLTNLIGNAIKFSSHGSTIWLSAEFVTDAETRGQETLGQRDISSDRPIAQCPYILFSVKDQGCGIPADRLDSIFGRFQQVNIADSRQKGGTGLGLAICRSIVQQHGGQIWAESSLGKGSTFYFTLPVHSDTSKDI